MRKIVYLFTIFILASLIPQNIISDAGASVGQNNLSIGSGSSHAIFLGNINSGDELEIDYSVDDNIDVLLMTSAQYSSWQSGNSNHIQSGSDYDDNSDNYVFTIISTDSYYVVFENGNQGGFASDTGSTVVGDTTISIVSPSANQINTRAWADVDSYSEIDLGSIDSGKVLSIDVNCDIGLTNSDDVDFLIMDSIQVNSLQSGSWAWNSHASFEDTCSHSWEYESGKDSGWSLVIDNSDQARTDALDNGIMVDIEIGIRSLVPLVEITDTSRTIDSGDYFRVDTGYLPANGVIYIDYSFWSHGTAMLTDDLDVMVMESSEANKYENADDAIILGHASMLDAGGQSWSYQFPNAGFYSIIFDNTDEPNGGAGSGTDIQVEIGITSLSIPSLFGNLWASWHQSRHYADEGDLMVMDLGTLNAGEDVYYYIDGNNEGGSIWGSKEYDILFMTKQNYDLYVNGSSFSVIDDGTKYKENGIIPAIENMTVTSNSQYMLVLDAADGPNSNSASENGDWIWEFIILSEGSSISNLQASDNHYEDSITVGIISAPDSDGDGVRNGLDECSSTPSSASVDNRGCSTSQLDDDGDGVANNVDQCQNTPSGETVDSTGCTVQSDSDNDGVADSLDQCQNTPAGEAVDANGCSSSQLDDDGDGVANNVDQCQNTPSGETVDSTGCTVQSDSDNDGVADSLDQCQNTPAGETVDANGCSSSQLDDDGDGVANNVDQCQNTPAGETVDSTGCTIQSGSDDDGDGVANNVDQCQNTPSGETIDANGCSSSQLDDDGDGVANNVDQCQNTPSGETIDANGCSSSQLDDDGDGVANNVDQCQNTPAGETVESTGCTIQSGSDDDGDGVANNVDQCQNTPAGETVDSTGCTIQSGSDDDGDGVANNVDQCQNTPSGETIDANGCSSSQLDDDGDGVANNVDLCQNTPSGETVISTGCTVQSDSGDSEESSGSIPGFSVIIAIVALAGAAINRRNKD